MIPLVRTRADFVLECILEKKLHTDKKNKMEIKSVNQGKIGHELVISLV